MWVLLAKIHQLLDDRPIRLPRAASGPTRVLLKAVLTVFLESVDPLACPGGQARVGGLPQDAETFGELRNGVVIQLVVFEEPLSLLALGNTFPGHGWDLR